MVPIIIVVVWCCTLDSFLEFNFAAVDLAVILYSRTGQILSTQNFFDTFLPAPHPVQDSFFIKASIIFALPWFLWG